MKPRLPLSSNSSKSNWTLKSSNRGGGPTDDKPTVIASPPQQPDVLSSFINLRVADMAHWYELWRSRGANFVTEPKVHP